MTYLMSDLHGEYKLFCALMKKIHFSTKDRLYICGDVIEKGPQSVKLLKKLLSLPNVYLIRGNHEDAFIQFYHSLMVETDDFDLVLSKLRDYIQGDGHLLDWEMVDAIENLPYYIETDRFICVHAGLTLTAEGKLPPLSEARAEDMLYNRRFKNPDVLPKDCKCVFYGHTSTTGVNEDGGILTYIREGSDPQDFSSYIKVHLDMGSFVTGRVGCFCIDNCQCYYANRSEI